MEINYEKKTPYTWGLDCLDKRFGKPDIRELIILFGFMSSGKTEFSYFVARKNNDRAKVCYISLELPEYDMKLRICRKKAGVSKINFQNKAYTDTQKSIMDKERRNIEKMQNLKIISTDNKSLNNITHIMRQQYDEGFRMFIIDNLDKITAEDREDENRRYQRITSTLQDMKNESDFCIMLIHHANKPNKKEAYQQAGMGGMRGSQKIMDNATQVFEIYRDLDPESSEEEKRKVSIFQMKDTFEGANGYADIYFQQGEYVEKREQPF